MQWTDPETGDKHSIYPTEEFERELRAFNASECLHERKELRRSRDAAGMIHIRYQCLACGALVGSAVQRASAPSDLKDADTALYSAYATARHREQCALFRKHVLQQAKDKTTFKHEHAAYLKTPEWRQRRTKVLNRAGGICEGCLEQPATEVHHLSYEHWRNELLFELVALCDACHRKCHSDEIGEKEEGRWP